MSHHCTNLAIRCMDFRLTREMQRWMEEQGYVGDCDLVSLAGAAKGIIDGGATAEVLLKQVELSQKLHAATAVVLIHHSQCGAYAAAYTFSSPEEEKAKQVEDMKQAAAIITERFPEITVKLIWANLQDGEGKEVIFEEIA